MAKEIIYYARFSFTIFVNIAKEIMFYERLFIIFNISRILLHFLASFGHPLLLVRTRARARAKAKAKLTITIN